MEIPSLNRVIVLYSIVFKFYFCNFTSITPFPRPRFHARLSSLLLSGRTVLIKSGSNVGTRACNSMSVQTDITGYVTTNRHTTNRH